MNLFAITAATVAAVNPLQSVTVRVSTGASINADGSRTPTYVSYTLQAQIQALASGELAQISSLNIQGTHRAIYLYGDIEGLLRSDRKGGDLVIFPDGSTWLVTTVLETWGSVGSGDMWCKVAATLQVDAPYQIAAP